MINFRQHLINFFHITQKAGIDIYNTFSFQHELAIHLRSLFGIEYKVQFERPASYFGLTSDALKRDNIDIAVFSPDQSIKYATEVRYLRTEEDTEAQMFGVCRDIGFLEELAEAGFQQCYMLMLVDDPLYYSGEQHDLLTRCFRGEDTLTGHIQPPVDSDEEPVTLYGSYQVSWTSVADGRQFAVIEIGNS